MAAAEPVNLEEKFSGFQDAWNPKIVGQVNDFHIKIVKVKGEFVWHHHDKEDELFLVVRGRMTVQLWDRDLPLKEGEFVVVPRGVEHRPFAHEEAWVLLLEPATTINTGNVSDARTRDTLDRI